MSSAEVSIPISQRHSARWVLTAAGDAADAEQQGAAANVARPATSRACRTPWRRACGLALASAVQGSRQAGDLPDVSKHGGGVRAGRPRRAPSRKPDVSARSSALVQSRAPVVRWGAACIDRIQAATQAVRAAGALREPRRSSRQWRASTRLASDWDSTEASPTGCRQGRPPTPGRSPAWRLPSAALDGASPDDCRPRCSGTPGRSPAWRRWRHSLAVRYTGLSGSP